MINVDFSSLNEYRGDGRKSTELRYTKIELGVDAHADGSCSLSQGLTSVLCLVNGPYQRPANSEALLKIDYTVAPFSSL
jgi:ribonuclease PH